MSIFAPETGRKTIKTGDSAVGRWPSFVLAVRDSAGADNPIGKPKRFKINMLRSVIVFTRTRNSYAITDQFQKMSEKS